MARFLGIAWDSGDEFTFKIWSEPDGDWRKGREYTCNVVCARHESVNPKVKEKTEPDVAK